MTKLVSSAALLGLAVAGTSAAGTDLGGGINTPTDVSDRALISRDLDEMFQNCNANNYNDALNIYTAGKNSPKYDNAGNMLAEKRSLMKMSTDALGGKYDGEPAFVTHIYGLGGGNCDSDAIDDHLSYADSFVKDALKEKKGALGPEAARALNLWMYATHELYDAVEDCAKIESGVNVAAAGLKDNGNGAYAMDEFIAFWIGTNQRPGSSDGGSLYAMTQAAAEMFGTVDGVNGEANVNTDIKALYNEALAILAQERACQPDTDTMRQLWGITHRLISRMSVPLVQLLISAMMEEDAERVRLYARSIVPQMSRCRQSAHRRLKEELIDRSYDPSKRMQILVDLQQMYECLGISCEDVGAYKTSQLAQCADRPVNFPLAQYTPTTDVRQTSKIDLDISELKVLLCFDMNRSYDMAKRIYMYGHNSMRHRDDDVLPPTYMSLQDMATSEVREESPWFTHFLDYHQSSDYADQAIMDALNGRGKWGSASRKQRTEIVTKTAQYQVVFMHLLGEMADANADCDKGDKQDNAGSVHSWDEVAALYVGSLEGPDEGGSDDFGDGQLMWNLGNKRCTQFGTENSDRWSVVMADIEDHLYAGRGQLDAYDCANLRKTVKDIQHLSVIPLVQSVVRYAIKNERHTWNSDSKDLAEGEAFALSVLPILKAYDPVGQSMVEENMIRETGKEPVIGGAQVVADAFRPIMDKFGIECHYVGRSEGVDFCSVVGRTADGSGMNGPIAATGASLVTVAMLWAML